MSRALNLDQLFAGVQIQEFDIHPNGRKAVCSVNYGGNWQLGELNLGTGQLRRIVRDEQSLTAPSYAPDGKKIVFQKDFEGDENHDILVCGPDGARPRKLTDGLEDNYGPQFSPDGSRIAFLSNRESDVDNLFVISSSGGRITKLSDEELPVRNFAWSPDGAVIAFHTGIDHNDTVSLADVERRRTKRILGTKGVEHGLNFGGPEPPNPWSPCGSRLLFLSNENDSVDIGEFDLTTKKARWLVRSKNDKYMPQWSPDGKSLAYLEVDDPNLALRVRKGRKTETFSPPDGVVRNPRWLPDGSGIAFINGSAVRPEEVFFSINGKPRKITCLVERPVRARNLSYPTLIRYRSFDGRKIPALLFKPKKGVRKAGIVLPHGGPDAQTLNEWDQLVQMLTDRDFTVIEPNYRGSTGYGREFNHLHDKDLGGGDALDTIHAGKYLLRSGLARKDRLGYWGASYSGYTCMIALTKEPDMWAAAVSIVGFFDWETEIASERGYLKAYDHAKMGDPKKDPEFFRKMSPIYSLDKIRAPLLMTASTRDVRCPPTESRAVVKRLRELGKKVTYHEYHDEGHWPRKRKNLRDLYERSVRFLDENIGK
jgi:dipeptidyl aminopeptidase/acylaminoacyl peptidase